MSHVGQILAGLDDALSSDPGPAIRESVVVTAGTGRIRVEGGRATVITGTADIQEAPDIVFATAEVRPAAAQASTPVAEQAPKADIPAMTTSPEPSASTQPTPTPSNSMDGRIGKLEGMFEGLRHGQTIQNGMLALIVAVIGISAAAVFFAFKGVDDRIRDVDSRMTRIETKVDALPDKIGVSVREANRAFSDALGTAINVLRAPQSTPTPTPTPTTPQKQ